MQYIALLRAVNVGGKNTIKMAELRDALTANGLARVQTYIQSGNIVFDSDEHPEVVGSQIENVIETRFGFPVDVIVRTLAEFDDIVLNQPYPKPETTDPADSRPAKLYVALLREPAGEDALSSLDRYTSDQEHYRVIGREIYLCLQHGAGQSKLAPRMQTLGIPATARNWTTIEKLRAIGHQAAQKND